MNVHIALGVARELDDPDACVVTILADTGERYLSKVFNDDWMRENQLLDSPRDTVASLLRRRDTKAPALVQVASSAALRQALNLMSTYDVSQLPVIDDGESVGSLVEGTVMQRALEQPTLLDRPVREVMDPPLPEVESSLSLERLASLLTKESPAALVRDDGKLAGIVSRYDVLRVMIGR
jgi:cystathionine beta-synthase